MKKGFLSIIFLASRYVTTAELLRRRGEERALNVVRQGPQLSMSYSYSRMAYVVLLGVDYST